MKYYYCLLNNYSLDLKSSMVCCLSYFPKFLNQKFKALHAAMQVVITCVINVHSKHCYERMFVIVPAGKDCRYYYSYFKTNSKYFEFNKYNFEMIRCLQYIINSIDDYN